MKEVKAKESAYSIIKTAGEYPIYPYLRNSNGDKLMYSVSPLHGRSFVVNQSKENRFVVSKGNGLSYTQWNILNTNEIGEDSLGLLLKQDALRDFAIGQEIERLGIKTNHMEYVLELETLVTISEVDKSIKPVLLQYSVECPYRIEDAPFMCKEQIQKEIEKWQFFNTNDRKALHLIAADVLIRNLRILHDNGILHNALTTHNHTWALELLDFEIAHSPNYPYSSEDDQRHVKDLFAREIIDIYKVILYIAEVLKEQPNFPFIDGMFKDYGFDLSKYSIN